MEGLSFRAKRGIFAFKKAQTLLRCAGVTFGGKSNQNRGGCDSPTPQRHTSVVCYVCYKSRKFETSFALLTRSTNFFVIFVKIFQPAKALEIFLLSADSAIYIRGYPEPHESDGVDIAAFVCTTCWAAFSRKVFHLFYKSQFPRLYQSNKYQKSHLSMNKTVQITVRFYF